MLINGRAIDVRLSTLPTINGEKLVMRVIDSQAEPHDLASLGYDEENLDRLRRALNRSDGLVLMTGPTGSGKTTALHRAKIIKEARDKDLHQAIRELVGNEAQDS